MARLFSVRVFSLVATLLSLGAIVAGAARPATAQELPPIPAPIPVAVNPATTALLVMDFVDTLCPTVPTCMAAVPSVSNLLTWARAEGIFVVHTRGGGGSPLPELAPIAGEPSVEGRADKFFNTNLEELLQDRGVTTIIATGYAGNGAVLYTSFEANARGYTVVAVDDAIPTSAPAADYVARYQLLNQPGASNPTNEPLRERAVTLSRSDLISVQ